VMQRVDDAAEISGKVMEQEMAEITKNKPQTEQEKVSVRNRFCSAFGAFLGVARAAQLAADECLTGSKRRATVSSLEASIKQMEDSILKTCQ
jgi:hypothetical protein